MNGVAHFFTNSVSATAFCSGAVLLVPVAPPIAAGVAAGAVAGIFIHPDLDVDRNGQKTSTHEEHVIRRWCGICSYLWNQFWRRYALTRKHRGKSHDPIIGTIDRWKYIGRRLWFLWIPLLFVVPQTFLLFAISAFLVMCFQDLLHILLDHI